MKSKIITNGFSKEWDVRYQENTHMSIWPWSDLISYVMRLKLPQTTRVLELGCGAGANIPFIKHLGMDYYAIEGSKTIVSQLKERFPEYKNTIKCGDFTKEIPFDDKFDLIIDRAALTCNSTNAIVNAIQLINQKLNAGGYFIGIDWYSDISSDAVKGTRVDEFTRTNIEHGGFMNTGSIHFSSQSHLQDLFSNFKFVALESKVVTNCLVNANNEQLGMWNFTVKNAI